MIRFFASEICKSISRLFGSYIQDLNTSPVDPLCSAQIVYALVALCIGICNSI